MKVKVTLQPEMATTWLTPAAVNAFARSRSTRSRRPMRIPAARPAGWISGINTKTPKNIAKRV